MRFWSALEETGHVNGVPSVGIRIHMEGAASAVSMQFDILIGIEMIKEERRE